MRLADIAEVRREYSDPPDPLFRINGTPGTRPRPAAGASATIANTWLRDRACPRSGGDEVSGPMTGEQKLGEGLADLPLGTKAPETREGS